MVTYLISQGVDPAPRPAGPATPTRGAWTCAHFQPAQDRAAARLLAALCDARQWPRRSGTAACAILV